MTTLFIDACPREKSRTRALAQKVLEHVGGDIAELKLSAAELPVIDEAAADNRAADGKSKCFDRPIYDLAKQFAAADCIVIAAPYWDMSFPALLKRYIEAVTVSGITFRYTPEGIPEGLCRAGKLYYVMTAGGPVFNEEFGYGYVRTMAQVMYGIRNCHLFKAENLDVIGNDVEAILGKAAGEIDSFFMSDK